MTRQKWYPLPDNTPAKTRPNLEQLMNARRPLLFSRMPRMLRSDGMMPETLLHEFRYVDDIHTHPVPVSIRRWKVALENSRILRGLRRRTRTL